MHFLSKYGRLYIAFFTIHEKFSASANPRTEKYMILVQITKHFFSVKKSSIENLDFYLLKFLLHI